MTHTYTISGMTCGSCIAKVKNELLKIPLITSADLQLTAPQASIAMKQYIPVGILQQALHKAGRYIITETEKDSQHDADNIEKKSFLKTYKPVLLIIGYVLLVSLIAATTRNTFHWMHFMQFFMGGFFLSFSFFKMLDLNGFADNYSTYDIIAKRWRVWGFIYAFAELALGIAYIANLYPLATNLITFSIMTISIIGVLQSVLNKRKIRCACLGAVFNLPMGTITIIEDAIMIVMSTIMLLTML